ncbi:hypothetical protein Tco_0771711 [Tanacetum coccineum]|uniref:Uncharacterized protein n=1 Tax=Tanacetum coccineum TaxID=301880 RepID=A0ABQ4ZGR6_9ASTR
MISPAFNGIRRFCKVGRSCGRALGKRKQPIAIRTGVKGAEHGDERRKVKNTRQNLKMGYPGRTKGRQLEYMYSEGHNRVFRTDLATCEKMDEEKMQPEVRRDLKKKEGRVVGPDPTNGDADLTLEAIPSRKNTASVHMVIARCLRGVRPTVFLLEFSGMWRWVKGCEACEV